MSVWKCLSLNLTVLGSQFSIQTDVCIDVHLSIIEAIEIFLIKTVGRLYWISIADIARQLIFYMYINSTMYTDYFTKIRKIFLNVHSRASSYVRDPQC